MSLLDSTRTLGVPGGSFHADMSMGNQDVCGGMGGSTISDCNLESDLSSDITSSNIVTCNGRLDQYQVYLSPATLSSPPLESRSSRSRRKRAASCASRARGLGGSFARD